MNNNKQKVEAIATKPEINFFRRNIAKLTVFLLGVGQFVTVATVEIYTDLIPLDYAQKLLVFSLLSVPILMYLALNKGADCDNKRFMKNFNQGEYVAFTHKAPKKLLEEKIKSGVLTPYPDKSSGILGSTAVGRKFVKLMDHPTRVTWGHYGKPADSNDYKQGLVRFSDAIKFWKNTKPYYDSAITVFIPIEYIKFPKGTVKKIFGKHQVIIEEEIPLKGTWVELHEGQSGGVRGAKWKSLGLRQL